WRKVFHPPIGAARKSMHQHNRRHAVTTFSAADIADRLTVDLDAIGIEFCPHRTASRVRSCRQLRHEVPQGYGGSKSYCTQPWRVHILRPHSGVTAASFFIKSFLFRPEERP